MSTQPNVFVGILSGQNEGHSTTITLKAGTPPSPPPGGPQPGPGPIGILANTITIDGEKAEIQAGGSRHVGTVNVLNPGGNSVVLLSGSPDALQIFQTLGIKALHVSTDPAGLLELFNAKGVKTVSLTSKDGTDGNIQLFNAAGKKTIGLNAEGASGWFGGSGVDGDVLVFAANASGSDSSQATVWIKGATGDVILQNADCAEEFEVQESAEIEPGSVLSLSDSGAMALSSEAYDRRVAGIVSGAGGLRPGIVLGRVPSAGNRWPIALSGKVFCKVDADASPVKVGDLLTTSAIPGHAMAARDHMRAFGAVIGKALAPLASGQGLVPVLVALQ
jgi:hypothetical protein